MVDAQTISIIFAGVSIGVAAIYYTLTLRNTQRAQKLQLETRQAQLFMQINNHLREEKFQKYLVDLRLWEWEDLDDYLEKYMNPEALAKMNYVGSFFECVGVLVYNRLLEPKLVYDLMATYVFNTYGKSLPLLKEFRVRVNRPEIWKHAEYLYHEMMKIYVQEYGHEYEPQPYL